MERERPKASAVAALILGSLCGLLLTGRLFAFLLPNRFVSEYSPLAVPVLVFALLYIYGGTPLSVVSIVCGCIGIRRSMRCWQTDYRRDLAFSLIGVFGGGLVLLSVLVLFIVAASLMACS